METYGKFKLDFFNDNQHKNSITDNALRVLMMGWNNPSHWENLKSWRVFKAIFIQRDYKLLKEMRQSFQDGFDNIFNQLKDTNLDQESLERSKFYISNCLSVLPFSDISKHSTFTIPQYINGLWRQVKYNVCPIELTPKSGIEALFIRDTDRVFAYGLEPVDNDNAEPHLIFMGTTYPAGQGFITQIDTDLEWFNTPGAKLYRSGKNNILSWTNSQKNKIHVCGMSLGGSLSLLFALDNPDRVSRVDALNPPGLCGNTQYFESWNNARSKPEVHIQKQGKDPISFFGIWKKEWHIWEVEPSKENRGPNFLSDHALNYAGFHDTTFKEICAEEDNLKRKNRNFWVYIVLRGLVYSLLFIPFRYIALPILTTLWNNKWILAALLICMVILPSVNIIAPSYLIYMFVGIAAAGLSKQIYDRTLILFGLQTSKDPECHDEKHFKSNDFILNM